MWLPTPVNILRTCQKAARLKRICPASLFPPSVTVASFWLPSPSPSPSHPLSLGSFGKCFLKSRPGRIVCLQQQQQLWCLVVGKGCRQGGQGLLLGVIAGRRYRVLSLSNRTTLKLFANGPQLCLFHSIKQLGRMFLSPPAPFPPHTPTGNTLPGLQPPSLFNPSAAGYGPAESIKI